MMTEETITVEPAIVAAPKKKRINSKKKGSGFEGHIGKVLGENLTPMKFRRSQSSGAILGGSNERFMQHYSDDAKALFIGDVVPTNEADVIRDLGWKLKFTLECKFYKTADNIEHLLSNTKIRRWFEQACTDAIKINKEPMLIFKFNHTEIFAAVNADTIKTLPSTLTRSLAFSYNAEGDMPARRFTVFHFKEALLDIPWWKNFTTPQPEVWSEP
jgi:hypothetical protein